MRAYAQKNIDLKKKYFKKKQTAYNQLLTLTIKLN